MTRKIPFFTEPPTEERAKVELNPLRLLDSKAPEVIELMAGAPSILDYLEPESRERFEQLGGLLESAGVSVRVSPEVVRGLDYYTETVFEIQSNLVGAQNALCGGGRYDDLIHEIGGPSMPSVGFAAGIERALLALETAGIEFPRGRIKAFVVSADPSCESAARDLARRLRELGLAAQRDFDARGLKAQFKLADRLGAQYAVVIGPDELAAGTLTVKDLATAGQLTLPEAEAIDLLRGQTN
jgi:histidyl-tRNA synthetase